MNVIKKAEYKAFIKTLKWGTSEHWIDIANALGVDKNTITAWKQLPEAQQAIREGIDRSLKAMEQAGGKDWRMWEAKLKMLGVNPATRIEAELTHDFSKEYMDIVETVVKRRGYDGQAIDSSGSPPDTET